jgi:tetratricopeptide (TPR) repeat protein
MAFPSKSATAPWKLPVQALVIILAGFWVFSPALHGDWLWDDDVDVTANMITQSPSGLWSIWLAPGSQLDYYPVKASVQWVQWKLWGMDTFGYHVTNLALHLLSALLVWRLLGKLGVRLAWLGGLIFAIHPVMVESVAWIAELKNTLSLPPFLLAMSAYLDYDQRGRRRDYVVALALFLLAMLAKTTMVMFPLVILLYAWWRRGRIRWADLKAAAPFLAISAVLGGVTLWLPFQHAHGLHGVVIGGLFSRLALGGLSLAFYFSQCFWPVGLLPIYPKWPLDPWAGTPFLPWLVLAGMVGWFWTRRHGWGRHALLGLGFFFLNLAPFLGLIAAYYMKDAWVMDHFLYLPIIGLIGLVVAGLDVIGERLTTTTRSLGGVALALVLAWLAFESHGYTGKFVNQETLWTYTLARNPNAWAARNNLGIVFLHSNRVPEALEQFTASIRINPQDPDAHNNLGIALLRLHRFAEARTYFEEALRLDPESADAHNNLGTTLDALGQNDQATGEFINALRLNPLHDAAQNNFGNSLLHAGRTLEARQHYELALRINPHNPDAHYNVGRMLLHDGHFPEALAQFEETLRLDPAYEMALSNSGIALAGLGRNLDAVTLFEAALRLDPDDAEAHNNLGIALAELKRIPEAVGQLELAVKLNPHDAHLRNNLDYVQNLQKAAPARH